MLPAAIFAPSTILVSTLLYFFRATIESWVTTLLGSIVVSVRAPRELELSHAIMDWIGAMNDTNTGIGSFFSQLLALPFSSADMAASSGKTPGSGGEEIDTPADGPAGIGQARLIISGRFTARRHKDSYHLKAQEQTQLVLMILPALVRRQVPNDGANAAFSVRPWYRRICLFMVHLSGYDNSADGMYYDMPRPGRGGGYRADGGFDNGSGNTYACLRWQKDEIFAELIEFQRAKKLKLVDASESQISLFVNMPYGGFHRRKMPGRPMSSVLVSTSAAELRAQPLLSKSKRAPKDEDDPGALLVEDARTFMASENEYRKRSIPYRRGILLHGKPGCGKTSFAKALATELDMSLYVYDLERSSSTPGGSAQLLQSLEGIAPRSLVVFEDVDVLFKSRDEKAEKAAAEAEAAAREAVGQGGPHRFHRPPMQEGLSLSQFLNAIDGPYAPEGIIFIFTSNHIENLDPAILRAGRVDVRVEFSFASRMAVDKMVDRFYESDTEATGGQLQQLKEAIPEGKLPMSTVQNFLLAHLYRTADDAIASARELFAPKEVTTAASGPDPSPSEQATS